MGVGWHEADREVAHEYPTTHRPHDTQESSPEPETGCRQTRAAGSTGKLLEDPYRHLKPIKEKHHAIEPGGGDRQSWSELC
jgi:hypothetical protein